MIVELWNWVGRLNGPQATVIGTSLGAIIGFATLVLGALFNAHLNRRRDERLQDDEVLALAAGLKADLTGIRRTLIDNADSMQDAKSDFYIPDISHSLRFIPHALPKIGLLEIETIKLVIDSYVLVDQYCERLLMLGGNLENKFPSHRRLILMPKTRGKSVAELNRATASKISEAIESLEVYLV